MSDHGEYLVTTRVHGKTWQVHWDGHEPLELDHPVAWEVRTDEHGLSLRCREDGHEVAVDSTHLDGQTWLEVPERQGRARPLNLQIRRLRAISPAYMPDAAAFRNIGPAEQYVSSGIREYLVGFKPLLDSGYTGEVEGSAVFSVTRTPMGMQITAKMPGVRFKPLGGASRAIPIGNTVILQAKDVELGAFIHGSFWWRVSRVAAPTFIDPEELDDEAASQELVSLHQLGKTIGIMFLIAIAILRGVYYFQSIEAEKKKKPESTEVELKKPKLLPRPIETPKIIEPPKPEPKPTPTPTPKPKPKPKPKPEPKPKPKPAPVAKPKPKALEKPRPQPVRKPAPAPAPPPRAAPEKPRPAPALKPPPQAVPQPAPKAAPPPPDPSVVKAAQQKAAVAKSLNFLSKGPSKNVEALAIAPGAKPSARYATPGNGGLPATTSDLSKMAKENSGDGPISTRGARNVASNSGIRGGHGKGLNEVQGKVSLNALYGNGSGEALGSAAGGGGMTTSGPGKINDADIEKTLARYLQRFQYCYEKALLADSSLAGTVQMQWTINLGGRVSAAQVARSAMNNAGLHDCLKRELAVIRFPSPTGGAVTVKKPFSFQSSSL